VLVTVFDDAVESVSLQSTGAQVAKEGWQTVDQLFDYAERAIADKNNHVTVEFDRKLGYPTEIIVSCAAADCGSYVRVRRLNEIIID
jgi:hypothetical protein